MDRRRAAKVVGDVREKNTGSSAYSRMERIHISTPCSRITFGSTEERRLSSHTCCSLAWSRNEGSQWILGAAGSTGTGAGVTGAGPGDEARVSTANSGRATTRAAEESRARRVMARD